MSRTATQAGPAGSFATARRGGLTNEEIRMIEAMRSGERPVSFQNIARRFGRCEADIRGLFEEPAAAVVGLDTWYFGQCDEDIKAAIRDVASRRGVSLYDLAKSVRSAEVWAAARDCYLAIHDLRPGMSVTEIGRIMRRNKAIVWQGLAAAKGERAYLSEAA